LPNGGPSGTSYIGDLAVGRYFTPHDVPFGDLVFYVAANWNVPLDRTSKTATNVDVGLVHRLSAVIHAALPSNYCVFFVDLSGTASVKEYLKERFRHPKIHGDFGSTDHDFMEPHI
jgi:hypothetical protein